MTEKHRDWIQTYFLDEVILDNKNTKQNVATSMGLTELGETIGNNLNEDK